MDIVKTFQDIYQIILTYELDKVLFFVLFVLFSLVVGWLTPRLFYLMLYLLFRKKCNELYQNFVEPIKGSIITCSTLIFIYVSAQFLLVNYKNYEKLDPISDLILVITIAWIASRTLRQFMKFYGIRILQKSGLKVNEILILFETIINILIGLIAVIVYAQKQNFTSTGLLAGVSIGGLAISLSASKTLEEIIGTVLLYLDRRFLPGEYIRLPTQSSGRAEAVFGRVESIGWRSTTIRIAGKNTIYIVSNAKIASDEIENISRGKKVMVLLYLEFSSQLKNTEEALVEQMIKESTEKLFGIAPGSTQISLIQQADQKKTSARITFSIFGAAETSMELRKNIIESTYVDLRKQLQSFGIDCVMEEPNIYVEAPVTL
jgi:MscS family membrane protein